MREKRYSCLVGILILCLLVLLCVLPGTAGAAHDYVVSGKNYVLRDDSNYVYSQSSPVNTFFYGANGLGTLKVSGEIVTEDSYDNMTAFGTNGPVSVIYQYSGRYQLTNPDAWYIDHDGSRWIRGYDLGFLSNMGHGCIMVESSPDGENWYIEIDPIKNFFTKDKAGQDSVLFTIPENDIKNGMYYRVVVAYRFARRTKSVFLGAEYDHKKCVEEYKFYVCSEKNYVTICDLSNRSELQNLAEVSLGFMIRKNGSNDTVSVRGINENCQDFDFFTDPGEYIIDITTKLKKQYTYSITVTDGLDFYSIKPTVYESDNDKGYPLTKLSSNPSSGSCLTSLSLATQKDTELKQVESSYGIKGKTASLYLKLNKKDGILGNGWELSSDTWGSRKDKELINGIETGTVGKGALIIQTSGDGKNWKNIEKGRYADGLYTTDYATHYGKTENVLIYTPYGNDVLKGMYIRVLYAYEIYKQETNDYRNVVELYRFYLCSDELGAVTFHNLSVADTLDNEFADADQTTIEVYKQAETLESESYTVTGFTIDTTGNPAAKYTVLCDGKLVTNFTGVYDSTGKYDITLKSAVGSTRNVTLYVDRSTPEEAMSTYFGDGFISGKRIFSEGEYPVYEAEEVQYFVAAVGENVFPLYGQITNLTTGTVITIDQNRDEKTDIIYEPGEYQAVFSTSEKVFTGELAGDARVFTFRFCIIANGTAPGPAVNQKLLADYSHTTAVDSNPIYYGLTFSSAGKGNITLAFADREAAARYAYEYEKGTVEQQDNGEYRYTGSFIVDQKVKFDSAWDLTEMVNYYAEAAVRKHYFDMSDEFTYLSLTEEVLETNPNLRQLELPRSVTVFAEGQKEKLTEIDALPLLNDKIYAYLDPPMDEEERGEYSFAFVTDQYGGIDSKTVTITDSEGGQHTIRYSESVGQQLLADNCPSGIVTVHEETMYGDVAEYQAVYIAPNENQTVLTLEYKQKNETQTTVINSGNSESQSITADSFRITDLADPLDPYAFVVLSYNRNEDFYTAKDNIDKEWSEPGIYTISCRNRLGYGYSFQVMIEARDGTPVAQLIEPETTTPVYVPEEKAHAEITATAEVSDEGISAEQVQQSSHKEQDVPKPTENAGTTEEKDNRKKAFPVAGVGVLVILVIAAGLIIFKKKKPSTPAEETNESEVKDDHE